MYAIVTGNLGRDAELKFMPNGNAILSFSVPDKVYSGGENKTQWVRVTAFGKQAERLAEYLKKGSGVSVSGELSLNEFVKKDGTQSASLELKAYDIKLVGGRSNQEQSEPVTPPQRQKTPTVSQDDLDGDIPF